MQHLSRYGRVWQRKKDGQVFGNKVTLAEGERITDYQQIPEPKEPPKARGRRSAEYSPEGSNE